MCEILSHAQLLRDVRRERGMTQIFLPHCHLSPPFRGPERGGGNKVTLVPLFHDLLFVFRALEGEVRYSTEAEIRTHPPQYGKLLCPLAFLVLCNVCLQQTASSMCPYHTEKALCVFAASKTENSIPCVISEPEFISAPFYLFSFCVSVKCRWPAQA